MPISETKFDMNYTCYLISNKPHLFEEIQNSIKPETINFFNGTNAGSFSRLVNLCTESCPTEIVIMMSDKMRPVQQDIKKTLELINQGYAFVGMYRFGFFGFKKELFRKIGVMDERFKGGGYEDDDFYIRLKEANLSMYLSHEVNYISGESSWTAEECKKHFGNKWGDVRRIGKAKRYLPELNYNYNLGPSVPTQFLPWSETQIYAKKVKRYLELELET